MLSASSLKNHMAISALFLVLAYTAAAGKTIYVDDDGPADFSYIQAAIDDSNDGDLIIVADGIYSGYGGPNPPVVDFRGKAIAVRSENGPEKCILFRGDHVAYFHSGENHTSVLCGFTITMADPGGGIACYHSSPTIMNNIIIDNWSEYDLGAIYLVNSSAIITGNVICFNDSCDNWGAGIVCEKDSSPMIMNNTIVYNHGGAVYCDGSSSATITNCILWDNGDYELHGCSATYSCIKGGGPGIGNVNIDPLLVNISYYPYVDFVYHLLPGSPCEDAGDNSAVPPWLLTDLDGNTRIINGIVDMGAYERPEPDFLLNTKTVVVPEGTMATFTVALAMAPPGIVETKVAFQSGDNDITIGSGETLTFDSSNYSVPQTVTLAAAEDEDHFNSKALIWVSAPGFVTAGVRAIEEENEPYPNILLVDSNAPGANNGTNWVDAFTELQEAISVAGVTPEVQQIWVAQGIYTPAEPAGNRWDSFYLINGVAIKGGYAGFGEPDPDVRDVDTYKTILSGDLNGDDGPDFNNNGDNSRHVVTSSGANATAILDGLTITGGNADSQSGGGIYNGYSSSPMLTNCAITENSAEWSGGGMYNNDRSSPTVINCRLAGNLSRHDGGGICFDYDSRPTVINCKFTGNFAGSGGGMYNWKYSRPIVTNCMFVKNSAGGGGGMYNYYSSPKVTNCTFVNNSAGGGGSVYNWHSRPMLTNCTFSENSATNGNALACDHTWGGPSNLYITNCILWDGGDEIYNKDNSTIEITYSDIWGGWIGEGNIDADPCFVEPGYWDANGIWVEGDYHLLQDSLCIDVGDPNYIAEPNEKDLDGKSRVIGGRIDMGAYEYNPPIQLVARIVPRTINLANKGKWISCHIWFPEVYNVVDIESNSVVLELLDKQIKAEQFWIDEEESVAVARFCREEVQAILNVGRIEFTITGQLTDRAIFEVTDAIRVIDEASRKSAK